MTFPETVETSHKLFGVGKKTHDCPIRELERISLKSAYTDEFLKQQEEHGKSWFMDNISPETCKWFRAKTVEMIQYKHRNWVISYQWNESVMRSISTYLSQCSFSFNKLLFFMLIFSYVLLLLYIYTEFMMLQQMHCY